MRRARKHLPTALKPLTDKCDAVAKVFFTYVERATLLGVIYAVSGIEMEKPTSIAIFLTWQFWLVLAGTLLLVVPLMPRIVLLAGAVVPDPREKVAIVIWCFLALVGSMAVVAPALLLTLGIGKLLAKLAG